MIFCEKKIKFAVSNNKHSHKKFVVLLRSVFIYIPDSAEEGYPFNIIAETLKDAMVSRFDAITSTAKTINTMIQCRPNI